MSYIIDDIIFLIVDLFKNKMCENKYNDDDIKTFIINNYNDDDIKTFINNNLNKDIIKETIFNHLLKNDINDNKNIIINEYNYNFFDAIQIYKKHFNNNELTELIDLLCNKTYDIDYIVSHYYPNKNEVMFYAKLALAIIYDILINNYDYEDRIFKHLTYYYDDENTDE
jgi:hypothetical protein